MNNLFPYPSMPPDQFQESYDLLWESGLTSFDFALTSLWLFNLDIQGKVWDYDSLEKWIKEKKDLS